MDERATCRHCGARLSQNAQWCPLCYTPVASAGGGAVIPQSRPPADDALAQLPPPQTPPVQIPAETPAAVGAGGVDPDEWAARLAAEEGSRQPGYAGPLSRSGMRVLVGVGGAIALLALFVAGFALLAKVTG